MSSRSSGSSYFRPWDGAARRSTSTGTKSHPGPSRVPSSPMASYSHDRDVRSLRDIQEDLEACDLQIANIEASKQHARSVIAEADMKKRTLVQARDRAHNKRLEMMRQSNALDTKHDLPPMAIIERSPEDYAKDGIRPSTLKSGGSQGGRSGKATRQKKVRFEVVGISRPARPKTIWGTPAWA